MSPSYHAVRGTLILLLALACVGWVAWGALKKSDDPGRLVARWMLTVFLLCCVFLTTRRVLFSGGVMGVVIGVNIVVLLAIFIGLLWAPSWASMLFRPLLSAFDGGDADGEIAPQYSLVEARRARGQFREALAEARRQLELFPNDLRLQLLSAEILVENLNDLQGAEVAILRIANQPHAPVNIASAFQQLADWQLKYGQDPDSAKQTLEKVIERFPDTPFSQTASQRIAHMTSVDRLLFQHDLPKLKVKEYEKDLGLKAVGMPTPAHAIEKRAESQRALELVKHLEQHPQDITAREELAVLYAQEYNHLDFAVDQLEELIAMPQQRARDVARWLQLEADLYIKIGNDANRAASALRRIMDAFPGTPSAELAQRRLMTLDQELNANKKSQVIKLGSYEKDIGLKVRVTRPPRAG